MKKSLRIKLIMKDNIVASKNRAPSPAKRKLIIKKREGPVPTGLRAMKSSMPPAESNPRPVIT